MSDVLATVNCNWHQNGNIPNFVSRVAVASLKKDLNKGNVIHNFKFISPLNEDLNILANQLAERLVPVI